MAKKQKLDPIAQRAQARYRQEGLTYLSNNVNVIPRDEAGNIIMNEGADNNPLLIIEPTAEKITTNSLLFTNVIKYYGDKKYLKKIISNTYDF